MLLVDGLGVPAARWNTWAYLVLGTKFVPAYRPYQQTRKITSASVGLKAVLIMILLEHLWLD